MEARCKEAIDVANCIVIWLPMGAIPQDFKAHSQATVRCISEEETFLFPMLQALPQAMIRTDQTDQTRLTRTRTRTSGRVGVLFLLIPPLESRSIVAAKLNAFSYIRPQSTICILQVQSSNSRAHEPHSAFTRAIAKRQSCRPKERKNSRCLCQLN